eukprot:TRINITY_DN2187_c0_g1_i3.p1 TRINITY_DN2187_c0_g1~~TRINITY_DN2187_c0_g1_i3.p1  ORF type:complete len:588 (+),score=100.35 TRINITY_DN2187_c0_g1_i3:35-1765(+)
MRQTTSDEDLLKPTTPKRSTFSMIEEVSELRPSTIRVQMRPRGHSEDYSMSVNRLTIPLIRNTPGFVVENPTELQFNELELGLEEYSLDIFRRKKKQMRQTTSDEDLLKPTTPKRSTFSMIEEVSELRPSTIRVQMRPRGHSEDYSMSVNRLTIPLIRNTPGFVVENPTELQFNELELGLEEYSLDIFRRSFLGREYVSWGGIDPQRGCVVLSVIKGSSLWHDKKHNRKKIKFKKKHGASDDRRKSKNIRSDNQVRNSVQIDASKINDMITSEDSNKHPRLIKRRSSSSSLEALIPDRSKKHAPKVRSTRKDTIVLLRYADKDEFYTLKNDEEITIYKEKELLKWVKDKIGTISLIPWQKFKSPKFKNLMLHFENSTLDQNYKFGVLCCRSSHYSENDYYNNNETSEEYRKFLTIIGQDIELENWTGYSGGLDTSGRNLDGERSLYINFRGYEIMYHVSSYLGFDEDDVQQISRKRHIGNDLVIIIFKESIRPFSPAFIASHMNCIFIVVSLASNEGYDIEPSYHVSVTRKEDVAECKPRLPISVPKSRLKSYLLTLFTRSLNDLLLNILKECDML